MVSMASIVVYCIQLPTMDPAIARTAFAAAAILSIRAILSDAATAREPNRARTPLVHPAGPFGARRLAERILEGSDTQFSDLFQMDKAAFHALVAWLRNNAGLEGSRYQIAEQKVMVVLWILGHAESQRNTAHKFQVSQSSVSRTMKTVLPMLVSLHYAFVRLSEDDWLDPAVELNPKTNAFNGCIGAIDGTHIAAYIPLRKQGRWRSRKGVVTQNVFAVVK
jgi:hypothetical protein